MKSVMFQLLIVSVLSISTLEYNEMIVDKIDRGQIEIAQGDIKTRLLRLSDAGEIGNG